MRKLSSESILLIMSTVQEKRDQFEWWLTCIPDKVEALIDRLPPEVGSKLNYSLESLSLLEKTPD